MTQESTPLIVWQESFIAVMTAAVKESIPSGIVEATLRDALAMIEVDRTNRTQRGIAAQPELRKLRGLL